MFDIWSEKLRGGVMPEYESGNIRVCTNSDNEGDYCYVFCSSNDIWYPNTQQAYEESILNRDRYEWTSFSLTNARKRIYVRDIYKSWYVTGINKDIDTIDKLVERIKREAMGLKLVCVGSSSGGYLATLIGCLLCADHVICFSGQMELNNHWAIDRNGLLQHYRNDSTYSKYYDLKPYIEKGNTEIFYIFPMNCAQDLHHYEHVSECLCIRAFRFKSKHHGIVVSKCNLPYLLNSTKEELERLYEAHKGKSISVMLFSIKIVGFSNALIGAVHELFKKIKRKLRS
jgi:hypothetical protein